MDNLCFCIGYAESYAAIAQMENTYGAYGI
jgi:hypothetical protein